MRKRLVIHPFLFAIFPVWFLYSRNTDQVIIGEVFLPTIVLIGLALISWALFRFLLRDGLKAGLMTSLLILLNFSYGHVYGLMGRLGLWSYNIGRHIHLIMASALIIVIALYLIWRMKKELRGLTEALNRVSLFLVAISAVTIVYGLTAGHVKKAAGEFDPGDFQRPTSPPDIYYIILDGYARADILTNLYGYDNSEFVDYLAKTGFFVGSHSRSNYAQTYLSLASSLNFRYLDDLAAESISQFRKARRLIGMIKNGSAADFLRRNGYSIVAFSSGYSGTELRQADIFISPRWSLSEFQTVLISGTLIDVLLEKVLARTSVSYNLHRERILFTFERIPEMAEMEGPVFVFAHILVPHPPFVFGEEGQPANPGRGFSLNDGSHFMSEGDGDKYVESYTRQLAFVNSMITRTVDGILSRSSEPPIIILQGDHGPGSRLDWDHPENTDFTERMAILNALYLPDKDSLQLYDEITPVNTFRVILNGYFGLRLPLLEDRCYFSSMAAPYEFLDVTEMTGRD